MNKDYKQRHEKVINQLKEANVTLTPQRLAVIDYLEKHRCHPSVDEIYCAIKKKYPSMSPATVYSTLQLLSEVGVVQELYIRGDKACFDHIPEPHHHLLCRECGRILDVEISCPIADKEKLKGHKVEKVKAYLYGVCSDCLKKKKDTKDNQRKQMRKEEK